jgi:hypothetical protein
MVTIPAAEEHPGEEEELVEPTSAGEWLRGSISGMVSLVIHLVIFLILATFSWELGGEGAGQEVSIGDSPFSSPLETPRQENLEAKVVQPNEEESDPDSLPEPMSPDDAMNSATMDSFDLGPPSLAGNSDSFDLGPVSVGGDVGGGSWKNVIRNLQRTGLDIVMVFDSTSSMGGEVDEVKRQVGSIGNTLMSLVPKTRIGICTYRDVGDEYVVKGLPLTSDVQEVQTFLRPIDANGGGDHPEAVQEGLRWTVDNNSFRPQARKVILLFGDSPPHPQDVQTCLRIASDFHSQSDGVVSTVSCRRSMKLPEFVEIAEVGGGESFLTRDRKQIMTQLMVLIFGSRYRSKVVEAFRLMGE